MVDPGNSFDPNFAGLIPAKWRGRVLPWLFLGALALAVFDKYTQDVRIIYLWCLLGICVVLDLPAWPEISSARFVRRIIYTVIALLFSLAGAEVARRIAHRPDPPHMSPLTMRVVWSYFIQFKAFFIWLIIVWLYLPVMVPRRWRGLFGARHWIFNSQLQHLFPSLRVLGWFTYGCLCMSFASLMPNRSFRYFPLEIGIYAPLLLAWVTQAATIPFIQRTFRHHALQFILLITFLSFLVGIIYAVGGEPARQWIEARDAKYAVPVRREYIHLSEYVWRLQFPFGHHNRLAYFSMIAALVFIAVGLWRRDWTRFLYGTGAVMAVVNLMFTLNRGAPLGLIAGVFTLLALRVRWRALALLAVLPVFYLALPHAPKQRVQSLFQAQTYENKSSTVVHRKQLWKAACAMIREYPWGGIGYGWKHFEQYYRDHAHEFVDKTSDEYVHAHNLWLQVAAETGLPLALLFFYWNFLRWRWLARLWRAPQSSSALRRQLAVWIALELMIQIFCFINLPLRRSLGVFTFGLWALMLVDLMRMQHRSEHFAAARHLH